VNADTSCDALDLRVCNQLASVDKPSFSDNGGGQPLDAWDDSLEP